ncbi:MAG: hypothetical protein K1X89_29230 [Myxococcaceae bacterium]|nr:hypothetical protein [Myxococcaceae bacterium]
MTRGWRWLLGVVLLIGLGIGWLAFDDWRTKQARIAAWQPLSPAEKERALSLISEARARVDAHQKVFTEALTTAAATLTPERGKFCAKAVPAISRTTRAELGKLKPHGYRPIGDAGRLDELTKQLEGRFNPGQLEIELMDLTHMPAPGDEVVIVTTVDVAPRPSGNSFEAGQVVGVGYLFDGQTKTVRCAFPVSATNNGTVFAKSGDLERTARSDLENRLYLEVTDALEGR